MRSWPPRGAPGEVAINPWPRPAALRAQKYAEEVKVHRDPQHLIAQRIVLRHTGLYRGHRNG